MKKSWIAATAALLVLSGCAADPVVEEDNTETAEVKAEEITPAPLEAAPKDEPADDTPEGQYLALIRQYEDRGPEIADATDEQLIAAGLEACRLLESGTPENEVVVVDGEEPNANGSYLVSGPIMVAARDNLC